MKVMNIELNISRNMTVLDSVNLICFFVQCLMVHGFMGGVHHRTLFINDFFIPTLTTRQGFFAYARDISLDSFWKEN